jgi:hypothetical protein
MEDRIFKNALKLIRKYLREDGMTTGGIANTTNKPGEPITIAGLPPYSSTNSPPIKRKKLEPLFRRGRRVQPKYPS